MAVYKFAGFWRRLIAYTVDNTIIIVVFFILSLVISAAFIFGLMYGNSSNVLAGWTDPAHITAITIMATAAYLILSLAYFTYFHGIKGRTPGKMLLGLQVLTTEGKPVGFGLAFLRSVGYVVSSIFYIGFLWAAFDRRKQGWHDKIAGTVVIILPRENEVCGLTVPDPQPASTVPLTDERQSEAISRAPLQPDTATAEKKDPSADQQYGGDQKTP